MPKERFPYFEEGRRRVSRDGHIEVKRSYYSVPPEYVGHEVWVRWNDQLVRILNHRFEQIAMHSRQEPGTFSTLNQHLASEKISMVEKGADYLLQQAAFVGPGVRRWAEAALAARGAQALRVIQGVVSLRHKYGASRVDAACDAAFRSSGHRYRSVKAHLDQPGTVQSTMKFLDEHPVIRPMAEYEEFLRKSIQGG